jgi:hypothetical protein
MEGLGGAVQLVGQTNDKAVFEVPATVAGTTVHRRVNLFGRELCLGAEGRNVNAPAVSPGQDGLT